MSNLFNSLGSSNSPRLSQNNPIQELKKDPRNYLKNCGFNIPEGVNTNNPQDIINGLIQSGQIGNSKFQRALQMARTMFGK